MEFKKEIDSNLGITIVLMFSSILVIISMAVMGNELGWDLGFGTASSDTVVVDEPDLEEENSVLRPNIQIRQGEILAAGTEYEKIVPTALIINDNVIEFQLQDCIKSFTVLKDVVVFAVDHISYSTLYVADFNGSILLEYNGLGDNSVSLIGHTFRGEYKIEGNDVFISSDNTGMNITSEFCKTAVENENTVVEYVQKTTYLGNGKFSDLSVVNTGTIGDYLKKNNFDCSLISE